MIDYLLFIIGIVITIISLMLFKKETSHSLLHDKKSIAYEEKKLLEYIEVAENIMVELKEISESIIEKIDIKTIELHNLLDAIDKKSYVISENCSISHTKIINDERTNLLESTDEEIEETVNTSEEEMYNNEVLKLYNEGHSPSQIAKKLDKGIGEIQLILRLKKR